MKSPTSDLEQHLAEIWELLYLPFGGFSHKIDREDLIASDPVLWTEYNWTLEAIARMRRSIFDGNKE